MSELTSVAVYRRIVRASLERVWENVHDWEHLPWLHAGSFADIELLEQRSDGWRARVRLPPSGGGPWIELDLVTEHDARRYVSRTVEGPGKGTEIWTRLEPWAGRETRIEVDFRVPGVAPGSAARVGEGFTRLYTRLWDEDQAMMVRRQALLDARRPREAGPREAVPLGPIEALRSRLPTLVEAWGEVWRVIEVEGDLVAHATRCPHMGGPIGEGDLEPGGVVVCPWHGYRFDVRSCESADGRGYRLAAAPGVSVDARSGEARLQWSAG